METAQSLVKGRIKCEKVFQQAMAKYRMPNRTREEIKIAESKIVSMLYGIDFIKCFL